MRLFPSFLLLTILIDITSSLNLTYLSENIHTACLLSEPKALLEEISEGIPRERRRYHFITSTTKNIINYASYAIAINAAFIMSHSEICSFQIHNEDDYRHLNIYDSDARWNKIKFLTEAIESSHLASSSQIEWFIWLDADLVIVDFSLSIEQLLLQYANSNTEIIMSRDKNTTSFIANSGFIIVKNSVWALDFLKLWWSTYDRRTCCDQNALTWLYQRDIPFNVKDRILFLNADIINTNFPSWENHHESCQVLHLAGLTSLYRKKIFQHGFNSICNSLSDPSRLNNLSSQLSITKSFLQQSLIELNGLRAHSLFELRESLISSNKTLNAFELKQLRETINDIMKYEDDENAWILKYYQEMHRNLDEQVALESQIMSYLSDLRFLIYKSLRDQLQSPHQYFAIICDPKIPSVQLLSEDSDCLQYLRNVQEVLTAGFESLTALKNPSVYEIHGSNQSLMFYAEKINYRKILSEIEEFITFISQQTNIINNDNIQKVFLYYHFKHHQFFIYFLREESILEPTIDFPSMFLSNETNEMIFLLKDSVRIWKILTLQYQYYGSSYVLADPEKEFIEVLVQLGVMLCSHREFDEGIDHLSTAIEKQRHLIEGYNRIYIATSTIVDEAKTKLFEIQFNRCLCLHESHQYHLAGKELQDFINELEVAGFHEINLYDLAKRLLEQVHVRYHLLESPSQRKFRKRKK